MNRELILLRIAYLEVMLNNHNSNIQNNIDNISVNNSIEIIERIKNEKNELENQLMDITIETINSVLNDDETD